MNVCIGYSFKMAGTVVRQKDNASDEVSWEKFLPLLISGEYDVQPFNVPLDTLQVITETVLQAITCTGTDNNKKYELMLMRRATASV